MRAELGEQQTNKAKDRGRGVKHYLSCLSGAEAPGAARGSSVHASMPVEPSANGSLYHTSADLQLRDQSRRGNRKTESHRNRLAVRFHPAQMLEKPHPCSLTDMAA